MTLELIERIAGPAQVAAAVEKCEYAGRVDPDDGPFAR